MVDERKALVVSRNRFFVGALSTKQTVSIFPRNRSTNSNGGTKPRTLEIPKISYGSQILGVDLAVTVIK